MNTFLTVLLAIVIILVVLFIIALIITAIVSGQNKNHKYRPTDIWEDRKRNRLGLPWTFTKYGLDAERFYVDKGFFNTKSHEVRLYRIVDLSLERSLWQRIIGTGTVLVYSSDKSLGNFKVRNIKHSTHFKELLSQNVEKQREAKRVIARENMVEGSGDVDDVDMGGDNFDV